MTIHANDVIPAAIMADWHTSVPVITTGTDAIMVAIKYLRNCCLMQLRGRPLLQHVYTVKAMPHNARAMSMFDMMIIV